MPRFKTNTLLLCALSAAAPAMAQTSAPTAENAADRANQATTKTDTNTNAPEAIVVTANRAPVRLDQVGQSITVLDQTAIEASQAVGITELLAQTPGVEFSRNGGAGKTTSLYIRGAETGQTVILYDGVRLTAPT